MNILYVLNNFPFKYNMFSTKNNKLVLFIISDLVWICECECTVRSNEVTLHTSSVWNASAAVCPYLLVSPLNGGWRSELTSGNWRQPKLLEISTDTLFSSAWSDQIDIEYRIDIDTQVVD